MQVLKPTPGERHQQFFLCRSRRCRRGHQHGAGIVEGVLGLLLITGIVVLGVLFTLSVGMTVYYKGKLGLVANQAAKYVASVCSWSYSYNSLMTDSRLSKEARQEADAALQQMGLPPATSVTAHWDGDKVSVSITVGRLPVFGAGNILPATISLTDTAVAILNNDQPPMLVNLAAINSLYHPLSPAGTYVRQVVPAYGKFWDSNVQSGLKKFEQVPGWNVITELDTNNSKFRQF